MKPHREALESYLEEHHGELLKRARAANGKRAGLRLMCGAAGLPFRPDGESFEEQCRATLAAFKLRDAMPPVEPSPLNVLADMVRSTERAQAER